MAQSFAIIAHRGFSSICPENTLQAFDAAINNGFCNFECDCLLTQDGTCVVMHDEVLGRTLPGVGRLGDHNWSCIQSLDAGSWFGTQFAHCRVPTLEHLLKTYKDKAHIHLELKSKQPELPMAVHDTLKSTGWLGMHTPFDAAMNDGTLTEHFGVPGITVTSFHLEQLERSLKLMPQVRHGWLVQQLDSKVLQTAQALGIKQLCPRADTCTAADVSTAISSGFSVRAWGIKNLESLDNVIDCGVQGGTVNWPDKARAAFNQRLHKG